MRALFVSLLFLLPAIGLGRSVAPVENGVAHYKKMRRAYFEVKGETQLDLCYTQFKKQRKYSAKRLNVLMDNGGKTHWDRYHKAHGSLPKFMRQCLDEVEGRVKSKCLNVPGTREAADRPQAGTAASAQRKSRIFKNFNCNSNKIKKLAAIEKEARVLGQLIARYEKHANLNNATALETYDPSVDLDGTGSGEGGGSDERVSEACLCPAAFNPVCGVDGETYSNSCQASCASVDVRSEGMCEAGGDGGVADGSCVCTEEYAPVCGANGETYSNQCHARCDSIDVISEGACAGTAESVDETAEIRSTIEGLEGKIISANSDLANCLSSAIERVPASASDSIDARKDFANQQCANYRGNYKSLVERKKALEGKLAERTSESSVTEGNNELNQGVACTQEYDPVCGADGKNYSNACFAGVAGTSVAYKGGCTEQLNCPTVYDPVCATNGETYSNSCFAGLAGATVASEGACEEPAACPEVYEPVCGTNGVTYSSSCHAGLANATISHEGACQANESCVCPMNYDPVCGTDGVTYSNSCQASCANASIDSSGAACQ